MSPQFRQALAVLQLTGCRPSELEKGVIVDLTTDGRLWIHIEGSKTGLVTVDLPGKVGTTQVPRGIDFRQLVIDPAISPAAEYLAKAVEEKRLTARYDADGLRSKVNGLGRQALGARRAATVSPYSYRHAMGCDLKSCDGLSDAEMSAVMGHRSMESLARYGRRRRGGGGPSPVMRVLVPDGQQPHGQRSRGGAPAEAAPADVPRPG